VTRGGIYLGGLSYQITGTPGLAHTESATIGNDFAYRPQITSSHLAEITSQMTLLGEHMRANGYLGMFGVDLIVDDKSYKLIEINARQPASIPLFTKIQLLGKQVPLSLIHLAEFAGLTLEIDPVAYSAEAMSPTEYAQVFIRADRTMVSKAQVTMGIYRLQSDNSAIDWSKNEIKANTLFLDENQDKPLIFYKHAYSIEELEQQPGILILAPLKGKTIKAGQELGRLQINQSAIINGELKPWIRESLLAIKEHQL
jgi:hypothetical protein